MQGNTPFLVAALLTWIAGFVDAVGFLTLGHIYTANMSGNSVAIGIQFSSADWQTALWRFWPVFAYVAGLLFCRLLLEFGARRQIRSVASLAIICEVMLLAPVWLGHLPPSSRSYYAILHIGLLAASMGIQNAALTKFSSLTIHTGFVTGTLVKMAEHFAAYLRWLWDHLSNRTETVRKILQVSFRQNALRMSLWLWLMWVTYMIGAVSGAMGTRILSVRCLAIPVLLLCSIIALDLYRPLATQEEQEQVNAS
jgi:uncharacterized membrane protein YoaK (UPF0700 family)